MFTKIQDNRVRNPLGVGLGLAICKQARAPPPGAERVEARQTRPVETHDATPAHSLAAVRTHTSATIPSLNPAACRSSTAPVRHSSSS